MIILVCGLSKSGKTSTLEAVKFRSCSINLVSASRLIKEYNLPVDELRVADVLRNQEMLVKILLDIINVCSGTILVDGHLLIETVDGPQLVPCSLLDPLPICGVIFVRSPPEKIAARRRGTSFSTKVADIRNLSNLEENHAKFFARRRNLPYTSILAGSPQAVEEFVYKTAGQKCAH